MPGKSYQGPLAVMKTRQKIIEEQTRRDVKILAIDIGDRNVFAPKKLKQASDWISSEFEKCQLDVIRQTFEVNKQDCDNIIAEMKGSVAPEEILVVGAHYDSVMDCPAANDNGSGVAGMLAIARELSKKEFEKTIRFVAFVNEEPPHFHTENMGSLVYAKQCRQDNDLIILMLSLETIGYYTDEKNSQRYPFPFSLFYPSTGNFVGFISNVKSRKQLRQVIKHFRQNCDFPSEGAALVSGIPGVGWSDHWSFWQVGYPAIMITDTAPFRYQYYHTEEDTPDKLVYDRMAIVLEGVEKTIEQIAVPVVK